MEFHVLGPLEVVEDGRRLAIASGRQRALLGFLVINAERVVSAERILDEVWDGDGPESGAKAVRSMFQAPGRASARSPQGCWGNDPGHGIGRLRPARRTRPDRRDAVRAPRNRRSCAARRRSRGRGEAPAGGARALAGRRLRGRPGESFAQPEIRRLDELRMRALEDRIEADLALGRHRDVIGELETLVAAEPLRERLRGQLMTALYRAGRQAEALRTYQEGRRLLSEELGIDPSPELQQLEGWILAQDARLDGPAQRRAVRNPYKGLRPFGEQDSADFFGRESLIARLLERLGQVARAGRFLAVVGPSGSGKSSVVRAGLVPALRAGALPGSERWRVALMSPGAHPMRELAAALRAPCVGHARQGSTIQLERRGRPRDGRRADRAEGRPAAPRRRPVRGALLPGGGRAGARALRGVAGRCAVGARRPPARRRHAAGRLLRPPAALAGFGELVRTGTEIVTPLARDELERAIGRPAASVGVQLEPGLATEVIADVGRQPGALPLLQYALTELFERSDGERLTREGYAAVGGVSARSAGAPTRSMQPSRRTAGRSRARSSCGWFLRQIRRSDRPARPARRVQAIGDDPRRVDEVLGAFDRGRLLSFDRDAVTGEPTVQVAHEALLARWSRLAGWIDEAREDLWTRRRLAEAAAEWIRAARSPGFLLSGSRLDLFASWATPRISASIVPSASCSTRAPPSAAGSTRRTPSDEARTRGRAACGDPAAGARGGARLAAIVASSLSVVVYGQGETANEQGAIATARELAAASSATSAPIRS